MRLWDSCLLGLGKVALGQGEEGAGLGLCAGGQM